MSEQVTENKNTDPFKPYKGRFESYHSIPPKGRDRDDIFKELSIMAEEENAKWKTGQVSGTFYHAGEEHRAYLNKIFSLFSHENTIQFDLCPSMFKMESEIISMTAKMLNGDAVKDHNPEDGVCGTVTSGGTESIIMAMKTYRDWARADKNISAPEIIMPHTAHPAFDKAGQYFGIKMVHIPVAEPDFRVDPEAVEAQINAKYRRDCRQCRQLPLRAHRSVGKTVRYCAKAQNRFSRGRLPGRIYSAVDRKAGL